MSLNSWANEVGVAPFYESGRPNDTNNVQPRLGIRVPGERPDGACAAALGLYFADALTIDAFWPYYNAQIARIQFNNDGRPDFAANPLNGQPLPTYEQAQTLFCNSPAQAAELRGVASEELRRRGAVSAATPTRKCRRPIST